MRPRKHKPHIAHILALSVAWLILFAGGDVALSAWQPPIGIPRPEFGIEETYRMYDEPANRNPELTYYQNAEGGYYTHYVDNTHPDATDGSSPGITDQTILTNPGTLDTPRNSVPWVLPEGSVVEVHGETYSYGGSGELIAFSGDGSSEKPIFIRGFDSVTRPKMTNPLYLAIAGKVSEYIIIENFDFEETVLEAWVGVKVYAPAHHIAVRNVEIHGNHASGVGFSVSTALEFLDTPANNIVLYDSSIHDFGYVDNDEDGDAYGVALAGKSNHVWIVDNEIYLNMGGVIINGGGQDNPEYAYNLNHCYIGRNTIHDCIQAGVWCKPSSDIIVSQNDIYHMLESPLREGSGQAITIGLGFQYGVFRVWYIFNKIHDMKMSGALLGTSTFMGEDAYFIGNEISHIEERAYNNYSTLGSIYVIGNTFYDVNDGAYGSASSLFFYNNIFAEARDTSKPHSGVIPIRDSSIGYNLYDETARIWWGATNLRSVAYMQSNYGESIGSIEATAPLFVDADANDFHLQSTSPAIDAGTSSGVVQEVFDRFEQLYGIDIRKDIEGNPRTEPWDIGAYEGISSDPNNPPPELQAIGNKTVDENVALTFTVNATDPNGEPITYSAQSLPSGATFSGQTFSWTPDYDQAGSYQVTFIASDGNWQDSETITITVNNVNRAPVLEAISDQSVDENALLSVSVNATDPDGDTITYSVTGLPVGAVFATQTFTWTPSYDQAGAYPVTFIADDGQAQDSQPITITVVNVNRAPVLNAIGNKSVFADDPLTFTIDAADPDGDAITYSADTLPNGATLVGQDFDWTPSPSQGGIYGVTFTADDGQLQDSEMVTITVDVDDLAPTVTNLSPAAGSIQVPLNNLITLNITDAGKGIDANSVTIKVNDNTVYSGNKDKDSTAYGQCSRIGTITNYKFIHQSEQNFEFDQPISVTVNATDLKSNVMDEYSYSFRAQMRSFGKNKRVDLSNLKKGRPATASDSNGDIWAAWHAGPIGGSRDIYIGKLAAGADNFGSGVQLTDDPNDQCNPVIAVGSDDKLYVAWQDNRQADDNMQGDWDIYISTSVDGTNWSTETRVNDPNDSNQVNPAIVVDGQSPNRAYVVWQDDRAGNQDIYVATSSDVFATKTVSQPITSDASDQVEPAIAADSDDTIYVVWTDTRNSGKNDIYGAASSIGPWTNIPVVTEEDGQSSPAIATEAVGSILHLVWVDDRLGHDDIFYDKTGGGLPGTPLTGSSIIDDDTGADQISPVIITTGYTGNDLKVFACWRDERNADADLYCVEIRSGDDTNVFVGDDFTNSDQSEPAIGIDKDGYPYLVWTNERTDICYAASTFMEPNPLASGPVLSISSTTTVGTTWNAIDNIDDVSAEMPEGAYSCDVEVTISRIMNPQKHSLERDRFSESYEFGPSGMEFIEPVTITIPYEVNGSENVSYTPYWYNPLTDTLSQQGITDVETIVISSTLHALRFKTTHFSLFILGGTVVGGLALLEGGGGCSISAGGEGNIVEFVLPYIGLAVVMVILKVRDARHRKVRNMTTGKC